MTNNEDRKSETNKMGVKLDEWLFNGYELTDNDLKTLQRLTNDLETN